MSQTAPQTGSAVKADTAILRAAGLNKSFRMGESTVHVLRGADLSVRAGEFVAIEGRSGSGKSTLLHILGGLDGVDDGTLSFDQISYTRWTFNARKRHWPKWLSIPYDVLTVAINWLSDMPLRYPALLSLVLTLLTLGWIGPMPIQIGTYGFALYEKLFWPWKIAAVFLTWLLFFVGMLAIFLLVLFGLRIVLWLGSTFVRVFGLIHETVFQRQTRGNERRATLLRNREFGFVFQFYHLLPELSVLENTLLAPMIERSFYRYFGLRKTLVRRAKEVLEQLGLSHRLSHRPNQLSGGERQRVAIARALMNNPKVLFADEPTGNLDAETGRQIMGVLEKLHKAQNQTIVMVTHDRTIARQADRILVLRDGKLAAAD